MSRHTAFSPLTEPRRQTKKAPGFPGAFFVESDVWSDWDFDIAGVKPLVAIQQNTFLDFTLSLSAGFKTGVWLTMVSNSEASLWFAAQLAIGAGVIVPTRTTVRAVSVCYLVGGYCEFHQCPFVGVDGLSGVSREAFVGYGDVLGFPFGSFVFSGPVDEPFHGVKEGGEVPLMQRLNRAAERVADIDGVRFVLVLVDVQLIFALEFHGVHVVLHGGLSCGGTFSFR